MSDSIKHECGIALLRLLKPISYYHEKYGTALYGLNKQYLLMEKQHNRGQDGVGLASIKLDQAPGERYISRVRSISNQPIKDIFSRIYANFEEAKAADASIFDDVNRMQRELPYMGELLLGHLRYGTHGKNSIEACHPFLRQNNWKTRNLVVAGNFNMTNVEELFNQLVELGQHPKEKADTVTVMEKIGHFLDEENDELVARFRAQGVDKLEMQERIGRELDIVRILKRASKYWDGGYAMAGLFGHGDAFVLRDPNGIRPAYFYRDEEIAVVASERTAILTAFNVPIDDIQEIKPGHALIIRKDGRISMDEILEPQKPAQCSFERIYFSRGNDIAIYNERKKLGELLVPRILKSVAQDLENTVFSYIPNTAETAFYGMVKGLEDHLNQYKATEIAKMGNNIDAERLHWLLQLRPRVEKAAIKDAKLRTFITNDSQRDELVAHVYDTTYGILAPGRDNLVVIDDSIVRGTTLKQSIITILSRLKPKKIVIVSSAPQIRYPDCYGIDMSRMGEFVAFRAAIAMLEERGQWNLINDVYLLCKSQEKLEPHQMVNHVKKIYDQFTEAEISAKIAQLVTPEGLNVPVEVLFQTIDNLHLATAHHGDWYFSGNYPTPGGNRVVNRAFINYIEKNNQRSY
ncbi:MAG: amidophosphoribosyltransferase [Sphingobacteriaceae bacterium]|nr:amidophosphoribosyltransferase [Sphingobacteriaceae bacterium]